MVGEDEFHDDNPPPPPPPPVTPTQQTPHTLSTIKLPILKKGEYDIWAMKMKHYLGHTDYPIWEVIQKGNGPVQVSTDTNGQIRGLPPKTAEEILGLRSRKKKQGLPAHFGKDNSKKMQKNFTSKQFESFSVSNSEGLHKGYDRFQSLLSQLKIHGAGISTEDVNQKFLRSLPTSLSQVSLIMRTKPGVDTLSFDDLYNNLRVFESDIKGSTASSSSTQNMAFVSSENTNSTNDVSTAYGVSTSSGHNLQKEGSSLYTDELKKSRKQEGKAGNTGYKAKDNGRRSGKQEEPKALVTLDGDGVDWTGHAEDEQENFALMAHSNSGSNTEKLLAEAVKEKEELKTKLENFQSSSKGLSKLLNSQMSTRDKSRLGRSSDVEDSLVNDRFANVKEIHAVPPLMTRIYMPSKPDFGINESNTPNDPSAEIYKNRGVTARDKAGLGYGDQMNKGVLSYENEVFGSLFYSRSSDIEDSPVNDRYAEGMHAVPLPMTGIYIPSGPDKEIDESQFTYGPKQSKPSESDARSSDFNSCESNSSKETLESMPEPVVNEPKVVSQPKVWSDAPIIEEYESDSDDDYVSLPIKEQETPSFVNTIKHIKSPRQTVKEQNTCSQSPKPEERDCSGLMSKKLGLGYGFIKKACFVCGSFSHLIRDCDFHEKRMAKHDDKRKCKGTGKRENRPVWNNVNRVNHQKQFVPTAILTRIGKIQVNIARASSTNNVNNVRASISAVGGIRETAVKASADSESAQYYFVLPIWSSYTSTVKSLKAKNEGKKPNKNTDLKTNEKPVDQEDQAFLEELESLKRQEKEAYNAAKALRKEFARDTKDLLLQAGAARATNTNTVNTANTPVSTASPSGGLSYIDLTNTNQDDSQTPALKDIYDNPSQGIFSNASNDDEGAVADITNLDTTMNEELLQFKIQKVRILIDLSNGKMEIGTKWVYRNKKDERGVVDWKLHDLFGLASYMDSYSINPKYTKNVYKVVKALYGLHQAPRAWYASLSTFLLKNGYRRGTIDKTLFIKKDKKDIMLVKQKEDDIFISQDKYVVEILKKFDFASVKTASTPIKTRSLWSRMRKLLMWMFQVTPKTFHLHAMKRIFSTDHLIKDCDFYAKKSPDSKMKIVVNTGQRVVKPVWDNAKRYLTMEMMFGLGNKMLLGLVLEAINDFLASSLIHHALTVSPAIYTSYIEQFWNTTSSQTVNDVKQINATVDSKAVVVIEASIRSSLLFNDADAVICLATNQKFNFSKLIFDGMLRNLDNTKKKFLKSNFLEEPEPAKKMTRIDFDAAQIARDAEIARQLQVDF
ncbi:putative ribonuclease H-like domain-containing protein [Tanacetum coccineum]